jgi:hypothetical protein
MLRSKRKAVQVPKHRDVPTRRVLSMDNSDSASSPDTHTGRGLGRVRRASLHGVIRTHQHLRFDVSSEEDVDTPPEPPSNAASRQATFMRYRAKRLLAANDPHVGMQFFLGVSVCNLGLI